jgi:hypothetical protein
MHGRLQVNRITANTEAVHRCCALFPDFCPVAELDRPRTCGRSRPSLARSWTAAPALEGALVGPFSQTEGTHTSDMSR